MISIQNFSANTVKKLFLRSIFVLAALAPGLCHAEQKIGVVLMHGKQGGGTGDRSLDVLNRKLLDAGMLVTKPEMPWSYNRYIDGNWDQAMAEIRAHVQNLKAQGATKIALAGHSLGSPAALSYAARFGGEVHALALMAPGHVPFHYSLCIPYSPIRMCGVKDEVERARKDVESGSGAKKRPHTDINQGRRNAVWMTPKDYLSYFDPESDAEMAVTAPRVPKDLPVLWLIGDRDYLVKEGRAYVFDKLPPNAKSVYLEVSGDHVSTPAVGSDQIVKWLQTSLLE